MLFVPRVGEIYKHFKGNLYQIKAIAEHTETGEYLVVYEAMYGEHKVYARPLEMFVSRVDKDKYPDVAQEYRFALQEGKIEGIKTVEAKVDEAFAVVPNAVEGTDGATKVQLDPQLLEFMDTNDKEQRLRILEAMHGRITDDLLATMAIVCDVDLDGNDTEGKYQSLKNCLLTWIKYEGKRLRD